MSANPTFDAWDSEILGISVYTLAADGTGVDRSMLADFAGDLLVLRHKTQVDVHYGRYLGELVELELYVGPDRAMPPTSTQVQELDPPSIESLDAGVFDFGGRYERDPRLAKFAPTVYKRWLTDASSDADRVVLADTEVRGVVAYRQLGATDFRLELIGVKREARGAGLGSLLACSLIARLPLGSTLAIGAYADNHAALGLYRKLGASVADRSHVTHYWASPR